MPRASVASVEVSAEADVVFADELNSAVDDGDPAIDCHGDGVGDGGALHGE